MKRLVLLVFLVLVAGQAQAGGGFYNGSHLLKACSAPEGGLSDGICLGYVGGASGLHGELVATGLLQPMFCMPKGETGVTAEQLALVVKKYLQEHPEKLHNGAPRLVSDAFIEAFPCK